MGVEGLILWFVIWVKVGIRGVADAGFLRAFVGCVAGASGILVATGARDINAGEGREHRAGRD